jgi:hypothetical protein
MPLKIRSTGYSTITTPADNDEDPEIMPWLVTYFLKARLLQDEPVYVFTEFS